MCLSSTAFSSADAQERGSSPPSRKLVSFTDGYTSYLFNHRSNSDTPYVEKNISQHHLSGNLNVTVAEVLPLNVIYWARQSNSGIFRDITDVQVNFDRNAFRNRIQAHLKNRLMASAPLVEDTLLHKLYRLKEKDWLDVSNWLDNPFNRQKLIEANEILNVPKLTYDFSKPDSINYRREDSLRKQAETFISKYKDFKNKRDSLSSKVDSLKELYNKNVDQVKQLKQLASGKYWTDKKNVSDLQKELKGLDLPSVNVPRYYEWLMGVRNFNLGRIPVNHSELTAKNISVKGLNFEYNSWYYLAITAGLVDYRFRDFALRGKIRSPQYLYIVRAGLGKLESNYLILSAFKGTKQLFASTTGSSNVQSINVTGFTIESKLQLNQSTFIIGEIGQSLAPDYRKEPSTLHKPAFRFAEKVSTGISVKAYTFLPNSNTRLEAGYKYTGANYQSFSSFQTNAAIKVWNIKAEQFLLNKKIKLTASLKNNEFSNPYILQDYNSNTVFKSFSATIKLKKWPVLTVGYLPMSQLTNLNDQLIESRFHTLNINAYHFYKMGDIPLSSTVIFNRFYNTNSDPGFIYYNASNILLSQGIFFKSFNTSISYSRTANNTYQLNVLEENFQFNITNRGSVGGGAKISNLNSSITKLGGCLNASLQINKQDVLLVSYEKGFIPGFNGGLINNDVANIQFTKKFNFRK